MCQCWSKIYFIILLILGNFNLQLVTLLGEHQSFALVAFYAFNFLSKSSSSDRKVHWPKCAVTSFGRRRRHAKIKMLSAKWKASRRKVGVTAEFFNRQRQQSLHIWKTQCYRLLCAVRQFGSHSWEVFIYLFVYLFQRLQRFPSVLFIYLGKWEWLKTSRLR